MNIELIVYRMRIGLFYCCHLKVKGLNFLSLFELENKMSIVHDNIQSLTNKKDILETELSNFDVIRLTETWLDQRTENVDTELNGYIAYRRDREGDSHGGVCVYVSKNFVSKRNDTLELPDIEYV